MSNQHKPDEQLRELMRGSRRMMAALADSLTDRPDMHAAIFRLMDADDMLLEFSQLSLEDPDKMRSVLQAAIAALVNMQSVAAIDSELKRLAVKGN